MQTFWGNEWRWLGIARIAAALRADGRVRVLAGATWCRFATNEYTRQMSAQLLEAGIDHEYTVQFDAPGWAILFERIEE